jgi:hypothetical protein
MTWRSLPKPSSSPGATSNATRRATGSSRRAAAAELPQELLRHRDEAPRRDASLASSQRSLLDSHVILIIRFISMSVRRLLDRREFLLLGASVPVGIRQYCKNEATAAFANPVTHHSVPNVYSRAPVDPNKLARFVDPLRIMPIAKASGSRVAPDGGAAPYYRCV